MQLVWVQDKGSQGDRELNSAYELHKLNAAPTNNQIQNERWITLTPLLRRPDNTPEIISNVTGLPSGLQFSTTM